jgi:hypothetical protein
MDEQQVKERLQRWFRRFRSGKPNEQEKSQLLIGGALYIIMNLVALISLDWKELKSFIPLEVLGVLIEVVLGGAAIWLGLRVNDAARRGRWVCLFILGRVAYAALVYPLIVFLFYNKQQAGAVTLVTGLKAFSFLVVFLPSIYAASLRIKSYYPELQEGNRVAALTGIIITAVVLPFLATSLGLITLVLSTPDIDVAAEVRQAISKAGTPLVLGFFVMFVAFIFATIAAWSMRHSQLLRAKLLVARINFRFAYLCMGLGVAGFVFRITPRGFWADVWAVVPWLLTMAALAMIQIPALSGWWRTQILKEVRGDYSPAASSRIRRLMSRCVRSEFVPGPEGLALQRAVTGIDVMDSMPENDMGATVSIKEDAVSVKYEPSGEEVAVELLEPEDLKEDERIFGSFRADLAAAKRAFELRRHGGDLRGQQRALQAQLPALHQALGELADEKDVSHEPTAEHRAKIAAIARERRELDGELKAESQKLAALTKDLDEQRPKHEGVISKAKKLHDEAAAELSAARQQRGDAERTVRQAQAAIEQAEQQIRQGKMQLDATGETALSAEARKLVEQQIAQLESQIKTNKAQMQKASSGLDALRQDEEKKAARAAELQQKLEAAQAKWNEVHRELEGKTVEVTKHTRELERRAADAARRLDEARREWGRALYETGRDLPALRKAIAPIDANLKEQAQFGEELKTTAAERETLRPGVQRFSFYAAVFGEAIILIVLLIVLLVFAL